MAINNESKRERFLRLANIRTNNVLENIRRLSNLSNRNIYEYDEKDINKIFSEIEQSLKGAKIQFKLRNRGGKKFNLK